MDFLIFLALIIVAIAVAAIIQGINASKRKKAMNDHINLIKEFSTTQIIMGADGNSGLAIDEQREKFA